MATAAVAAAEAALRQSLPSLAAKHVPVLGYVGASSADSDAAAADDFAQFVSGTATLAEHVAAFYHRRAPGELSRTDPVKIAARYAGRAAELYARLDRKFPTPPTLDDAIGGWRALPDTPNRDTLNGVGEPAPSQPLASPFRVVTYNIWFSPKYRTMRFAALMDILLPEAGAGPVSWPACVALQEVCKETAALVLAHPRVRSHYFVTDPSVALSENWYGVVTLVARWLGPAARYSAMYYSFGAALHADDGTGLPGRSQQGRGLLSVTTPDGCVFGNVHLESPTPGVLPSTRRDQLALACAALEAERAELDDTNARHVGWCLAGDFNFCSPDEDVGILGAGGVDLWAVSRPGEPGNTFDTRRNANIVGPWVNRPDRVVVSTDGFEAPTNKEASAIAMLGEDAIPGIGIQPSDHFGLLATLRC